MSNLTDHLKECAGLGTLPPLIEKCEDIPGYSDRVPRSTCSGGGSGSGAGGNGSDDCFACGNPKPPPPPPPPVVEIECPPPSSPELDAEAIAKAKALAMALEEECIKAAKPRFPPMPVSDCAGCKPSWFSCSPSISKTYPVPAGVEVLPISIGGRSGKAPDCCGKCGEKRDRPSGKPKVSMNCPMMKAKCPGLAEELTGGLFTKLASLFGFGGKK